MPAIDPFTGQNNDFSATGGQAVTPHDTNELEAITRALYVGTAGDLTVVMRDGTELTFANAPVGWHPLRVKIVMNTGTDADDIVAVW